MGNIIIKRQSENGVFIRGFEKENCAIAKDVQESNGELPADTSVKLFDIKKFQANITRELKTNGQPNRAKLENQCIVSIGFVRDAANVLDLPVWLMLINVVALDMLRSRLPSKSDPRVPLFANIFDRSVQDEDPYSVPSLPKLKTEPTDLFAFSNNVSYAGLNGYTNDARQTERTAVHPMNGNGVRRYANNGTAAAVVAKQRTEKENNPVPPELPPRDFPKIGGAGNGGKKTKTGRNIGRYFRFRKSGGEGKKKSSKEEEEDDEQLLQIQARQQQQNEIEYGL